MPPRAVGARAASYNAPMKDRAYSRGGALPASSIRRAAAVGAGTRTESIQRVASLHSEARASRSK